MESYIVKYAPQGDTLCIYTEQETFLEKRDTGRDTVLS